MVRIPGATFVTGTDSSEIRTLLARYQTTAVQLFSDEVPRRQVHVDGFWLDRTEVTKAQFREFLLAVPAWQHDALPPTAHTGHYLEGWTGATFAQGEAQRPVAFVTWPSARAFCQWAGKRLPTELEWEWAARGGTEGEFPWGNEAPDASRVNWGASGIGAPADVGRYAPNGHGLHDMAGNVWEFTADVWMSPESVADRTIEAPSAATRFVIRGGSFGAGAINLRTRYRDSHPAGNAVAHVGFRCARSLAS